MSVVAYSTKKFSMLADLGTRAGRGGNYGLAKKAAEKMIELCAEHPTGHITLCARPTPRRHDGLSQASSVHTQDELPPVYEYSKAKRRRA